jgi:hypothetical protein
MDNYCVFFYDGKSMIYYIYYNNGNYEETYTRPLDIHSFEHSKLTKISINEQLEQGITLENILKDYCEKIQIWRDELLNSKSLILPYDFMADITKSLGDKFIHTNESNILRFFNKYSTKIYTNDKFDKVTWNEYLWFEKPYNGALNKHKKGIYNCLGYDFKMSYPTLLSSKLILNNKIIQYLTPTKKGKLYRLEKLKKELKYGLYRVKITSTNEDFNFIFNFKNDTNVYTHYDIEFCRKHQEQYNITIDLIIDDEPNALLYRDEKLINGREIFVHWYNRLCELKQEFPKNGLIKLLSSSIWGYLSKRNSRYYNDVELDANPDITMDDDENNDKVDYLFLNVKDNINETKDYLLLNKKQPCTKNYRLKPFITSIQRIVIAEICTQIGINKVVRINTDCIVFNKDLLTEQDIKTIKTISPTFIPEAKTTGKFNILHTNNFIPVE